MDRQRNHSTLTELVSGPFAQNAILAACENGLMAELVPEFLDLRIDDEGRGRHKDNLWHSAVVVSKCPDRPLVRLSAFFHDIGKPATRAFVDGKVTFYGHEAVGARMTRSIMTRLGYSKDEANYVSKIVEMSGRVRGADNWTDSAVRRFIVEADDSLDDLLDFCFNDTTSKHASKRSVVERQVDFLRGRIREVAEKDAAAKLRPPINGHDIMERHGLSPGRELGLILSRLNPGMSEDEAWAVVGSALREFDPRP